MQSPQQDSDGVIWAVLNERQLVYLGKDGFWHPLDDPGRGHGHITKFFVDSADTLWLVVDDRLYRRPLKQPRFLPTNVFVYGVGSIKQGRQHDLWIASSGPQTSARPAPHLQHLDNAGDPVVSPRIAEDLAKVLPVADGSLWMLTVDNVLFHLRKPGLKTYQTIQIKDSQNAVQLRAGAESLGDQAFIQGSDGGIWIGGMGGLEHFAAATLVPAIPGASAGQWENCIDSAGALWIASPKGMLFHAPSVTLLNSNTANPLQPAERRGVENIFCSNSGRLALADESGIAVLEHNRFSRLPLPSGLKGYGNHYIFTGVTQTPDGKVIAAAAGGAVGRSLWIYSNGKWEKLFPVQDMPEVTAFLSDSDTRLFLGFRSNNVGILDHGAFRILPTTQPGIGATLGFANTSYGMFAYGWNGIAIREKDAFHMLAFARPDHARSVTGLVEARNGDLWINGGPGIVKIPSSEIREGLTSADHKLFSINLQEGDFVGSSYPGLFSSSAHIDSSGRLWFSTLNGVISVSPECIRPAPPPILTIRGVYADGRPLRTGHLFPPDVGTLTIDYIGVDLKNPHGVSYRYRLGGLDKAWQDVGARKEAIYTHLHPGRYSFEVIAANAYGVWTPPVSVPFAISPHFYQTLWFRLLSLMVLLALVWFGVRMRLKYVTAAIRARAEERADERIRISRDLHDTLLQGVQGLLLTFHSAAERVPADHQSRPALEQALTVAERIILEGRDRVKGLRALNLTDEELRWSLETLGLDLNSSGKVDFAVTCFEAGKKLQPHVASEIFLITREAVINAFRHAEPSRVSVELHYGNHQFSLRCVDNGRGFDADTVAVSEHYGHWGIRGMAERAHKLGASFEYCSSTGSGTVLSVGLKARRAYE